MENSTASTDINNAQWQAPTTEAQPGIDPTVQAAEVQAQNAAEQVGLTDGQFTVQRGSGETAYTEKGWKVVEVGTDIDKNDGTEKQFVVIGKDETDADGNVDTTTKDVWLDKLNSWQLQESAETAEVMEAESALEAVGAVAVHAEGTIELVDTSNDVTVPKIAIDMITAEEGSVEEAASIPDDQELEQTTEDAPQTELLGINEAKIMSEALSDKFAPVGQSIRQLAGRVEEEIGGFLSKQKGMLDNVGTSVQRARNMAGSIMDMSNFVRQLENNSYGEISSQDRQNLGQLAEGMQVLSRYMNDVESSSSEARRRGGAMQGELGQNLVSAVKAIENGLEEFKQNPAALKDKALEADQERTAKKESDPDYTVNQQKKDDSVIGDLVYTAGEATNRTNVVVDETGAARKAITRTLDIGNFNLTDEILSSSRLGGHVVEDINNSLRVVTNRLNDMLSMRGSRGNLHAELRPLINGYLAPLVDSIMRIRPPDVRSSEQPRQINKVTSSVAQMEQAATFVRSFLESLKSK